MRYNPWSADSSEEFEFFKYMQRKEASKRGHQSTKTTGKTGCLSAIVVCCVFIGALLLFLSLIG